MLNEPITEAQIEDAFEEASREEEESARQEKPIDVLFADRALLNDSDEFELIIDEIEWDFGDEMPGITMSELNPHGVFTPDGRQIGSICGCEDYPCCGH